MRKFLSLENKVFLVIYYLFTLIMVFYQFIVQVTEFGCADMSLALLMRRHEHLQNILQVSTDSIEINFEYFSFFFFK